MQLSEIKSRIENGLSGAQVEILDPFNDGVHIKAVVVYSGFNGKSLIQQHRMVFFFYWYGFHRDLHAL
ncbi:MAG: BolA/IbaG family iron-sulfur metabolism protein, partial [Leptospiraceae bacterium]|nr:BolA/IbaG family iron-sulfur metabolism protein [Leptospiraceae bacterium]